MDANRILPTKPSPVRPAAGWNEEPVAEQAEKLAAIVRQLGEVGLRGARVHCNSAEVRQAVLERLSPKLQELAAPCLVCVELPPEIK